MKQSCLAPRANTYYSTFNSGLEGAVSRALRESLAEVEVKEVHEGLILYASPLPPRRIRELRFFRNSFLLLRRLETSARPPAAALRGLAGDRAALAALGRAGAALRGSFRIMIQDGSRLVTVDGAALATLERAVSEVTGWRGGRGRPDHELWLHLRDAGPALFSLRVTRHPALENVLEPGELRPELVDVLCRLSEPRAGELFLDPFAGWGAIPLARARHFPRGLVLANDADEEKVQRLQEKVAQLGLKRQMVVRRVDALEMTRYEDACVAKIVTDPPWGLYRELGMEPGEFYRRMLDECRRVLQPGGLCVLLMARGEAFEELARSTPGLALRAELPILMSGKKATIYQFEKTSEPYQEAEAPAPQA